MATFRKRGSYQWEARIRKKGYPTTCKTFETKADAEAWAKDIETSMNKSLFVSSKEAEQYTLSECLDRYIGEYLPRLKHAKREEDMAKALQRRPIAHRIMATIRAKQTPNNSIQGFVAMWFNDKVNHVYSDCFAPAIRAAGYEPHRVDEREHIGKIDDEIILQIRRSRFVVADATGTRGGVYYEAGFAHGMGIPVFWTCREDHGLHFDVRQYNCIFWKSDQLSEFRKALAARIEAVLGQGPHAKISLD